MVEQSKSKSQVCVAGLLQPTVCSSFPYLHCSTQSQHAAWEAGLGLSQGETNKTK